MDITLLKLAFLFFCGSLFGWIFELFFRRIFSQKKWVNPGFLTGPYLPIYGFGLTIMYVISEMINHFMQKTIFNDILAILIIGILLTLIEYIGGIIFIKGLNIKLWDYSDRPGNIQGIICPLFSFMWTTFGALYYFFVNPYIQKTLEWLSENLAFSFFVGLFFGFLIIDLWNSLNLGSRIRKLAKEKNIVVKYETLKVSISSRKQELKQKINFALPFKAIENFKLEIENYIEKENQKKK